jgi:hypothetical protein
MVPNSFPLLDSDAERRRVLAKVYSLLIKLAEETEAISSETNQNQATPEPLKDNIPTQGRV